MAQAKPSVAVSKVSATKAAVKSKAGKNEAIILQKMIGECFFGPMPPPDLMEGYHKLDKTFPNRLLRIVEKEQNFRHECEKITIDKQFSERKRGQIFGLIIGVFAIIAGVVCAISGAPWVGGFIGTGGVTSLVAVFVLGRKETKK